MPTGIKFIDVPIAEAIEKDYFLKYFKISVNLRTPFETVRWGKIVQISCIRRRYIRKDDALFVRFRGDLVPVRAQRIELPNGQTWYRYEIN